MMNYTPTAELGPPPAGAKQCRQCGEYLPLAEFYRHSQMADGHLNKCMDCVKARVSRHRRANDSVREYDRQRALNPERTALRNNVSERYRIENPHRVNASTKVRRAILSGKMEKEPCAFCGRTDNIHAHHPDYDKPLDVVWLCVQCHRRLHAILPKHSAEVMKE